MTTTKIPISELHTMARQMKMYDFINWFAEKYMNIPSTVVKPDIYLTIADHSPVEQEKGCDNCASCTVKYGKEPCASCTELCNWKSQPK